MEITELFFFHATTCTQEAWWPAASDVLWLPRDLEYAETGLRGTPTLPTRLASYASRVRRGALLFLEGTVHATSRVFIDAGSLKRARVWREWASRQCPTPEWARANPVARRRAVKESSRSDV